MRSLINPHLLWLQKFSRWWSSHLFGNGPVNQAAIEQAEKNRLIMLMIYEYVWSFMVSNRANHDLCWSCFLVRQPKLTYIKSAIWDPNLRCHPGLFKRLLGHAHQLRPVPIAHGVGVEFLKWFTSWAASGGASQHFMAFPQILGCSDGDIISRSSTGISSRDRFKWSPTSTIFIISGHWGPSIHQWQGSRHVLDLKCSQDAEITSFERASSSEGHSFTVKSTPNLPFGGNLWFTTTFQLSHTVFCESKHISTQLAGTLRNLIL